MNNLLEETLRERAERAAPLLHPTDLGRVVDRAGRLRRRRATARTLVAALVVVIAVTGLAQVVGGLGAGPRPPVADRSRGTATASAAPVRTTAGPLSELPQGAAPAVGYALGSRLHLGDGTVVDAPGGRAGTGFAPYAGGLLVVDGTLRRYTGAGRLVASYGSDAPAAVSADGRSTAWVDGSSVLVGPTSGTTPQRRTVPGALSVAGFLPGGALAVDADRPLVVGPRSSRPVPGLRSVSAANQRTGLVSGQYDARGRFAVVDTASGRTLWRTPLLLGRFSPDGRHVVALPSAPHPRSVLVLDARTGQRVATVALAAGSGVRATAWEDDTHLLAVVADSADHHALVRIGVDGTVERATPVGDTAGGTYVLARTP